MVGGFGYSYQKKYNGEGLVFSISSGQETLPDLNTYIIVDGKEHDGIITFWDMSIAYQMKAKKKNFWSFGILLHKGVRYVDSDYTNDFGVSGWCDIYKTGLSFYPVIGWDIRF